MNLFKRKVDKCDTDSATKNMTFSSESEKCVWSLED